MGRAAATEAWELDLRAALLAGHRVRAAARAQGADQALQTADPDGRYLALMAHLGHSNCTRSPAARACVLQVMQTLRQL